MRTLFLTTSPFSFRFRRKYGQLPTIFWLGGTDERGTRVHTLCFFKDAISSSYPRSHASASVQSMACLYILGSSSAAVSRMSTGRSSQSMAGGLAVAGVGAFVTILAASVWAGFVAGGLAIAGVAAFIAMCFATLA